jgi:phospholipid/cholesterol/gamma-HCH transport system substrate-binding protein
MEIRARYVLIGLFTLVVILAGFAAVYWLNHAGGLGERTSYRVRFEGPVSGLNLGSDVLFNGVRVGEVTDLRLDGERPAEVMATIAVAAATPVRADTRVGLAYGGLTGTASVMLEGGTAEAPPLRGEGGVLPELAAQPGAAKDWTTAARDAFGAVESLLADNADALHETIGNIDAFAAALGRNSDRVDKIVSGLERMTGGAAAAPATIYDLRVPPGIRPAVAPPAAQLVVALPTAVVSLDTQRFLVGTDESQNLAFDAAKWSDSIPNLVRAKLIEALEDAGYLRTGGDMQGLAADRQLLTDIRAFRISPAPGSAAFVELTAKLVGSDGQVLAGRAFRATAPVAAMDAASAAAALNAAFGTVATDLVAWVMQVP